MSSVVPLSLADEPALIERLLPVQKLSAESYKEQMAGSGKTLTALGSYWKGRKPLVLAKACVLGCLLPATDNPDRDLQIFEMLMAMDDEGLAARAKRRPTAKQVLCGLQEALRVRDYFRLTPEVLIADTTPLSAGDRALLEGARVAWREDVPEQTRRHLEAAITPGTYRERVLNAWRAEEMDPEALYAPVWERVNAYLGTDAHSFPELVEQLGIMRWGHRPRVADTFCGSGQIPFEAARLGCDVYASDLNPIACLLTWGAFHIVGGSPEERAQLERDQARMAEHVRAEIDRLGVETDGSGARAKVFLYCVETRCPQTGWMVPLLPSRVISKSHRTIAELIPDPDKKRYRIEIRNGVSERELLQAEQGTVRKEARGAEPCLVHTVDGREYRMPVSTIRGDYRLPDGTTGNRLRPWELHDFMPRPDDIFQERLYCIQWLLPGEEGARERSEFRAVTEADLERERVVQEYVRAHLAEWQRLGYVPDMRIESGDKTDEPIRTRGWTCWHHLFNPRQLMIAALCMKYQTEYVTCSITQVLDYNSRLCAWNPLQVLNGHTFYNQALNTLYTFGCRATSYLTYQFLNKFKHEIISSYHTIRGANVLQINGLYDAFITDPPYGNAVKYEEILDFFIAWLRKNPPEPFREWVWDSRRELAITGEDDTFRQRMAAAYRRMADNMPDNGIQVVMFTHQSGAIWADMANIMWAAGLQVTAAWYVVTETDSALRQGSYVKGTVLLVLRKRTRDLRGSRADLGWEIQEAVSGQVRTLVGLNQRTRMRYRDENLFEDADLQMAGYAAALRVLTQYCYIDGKDMTEESLRPRVKGQTSVVDELITFAVDTANGELRPTDLDDALWSHLSGAERFYLKLLELEARGLHTLDNYQNFAKAFKVRDYRVMMADERANKARLKSAQEFGRLEMGASAELGDTPLRAVLYALMELQQETEPDEVLAHLAANAPQYWSDAGVRQRCVQICAALERRTQTMRPAEASAARVLAELIQGHRL